MELYSLARWQFENPRAPFLLGGEFLLVGQRRALRNAHIHLWLNGSDELFANVRSGDLIAVDVVAVDSDSNELKVADVQVIHPAKHELPSPPKPHVALFLNFISRVRSFFLTRGLNEVMTPSLVVCPGLEPSLEPFSTEMQRGGMRKTVFLPTSPEVHLKRALALGWHDVFEIRQCFRKGEYSEHHQPEFTMLEWYRGFADLDQVILDLKELVKSLVLKEAKERLPEIAVRTFHELFDDVLSFDLQPYTSAKDLRNLAIQLKLDVVEDDTFQDLFHRLMIEKIEPRLKAMGPTIVRDFPPELSALAKINSRGWSERFEFYWNGFEIANAFFEVTDPVEQRQRWQRDRDERQRLGTTTLPEDQELIRALEKGIPPTGGIAMGLERLYMAMHRVDDIRDLRLFSSDELTL